MKYIVLKILLTLEFQKKLMGTSLQLSIIETYLWIHVLLLIFSIFVTRNENQHNK